MKIKKILFSALVLSCIIHTNINAIIHRVIKLQHNDTLHFLYLCFDAHADVAEGAISEEQRNDFLEAAQNKNAYVIVEDGTSYDGDNVIIQESITAVTPTHLPGNFIMIVPQDT